MKEKHVAIRIAQCLENAKASECPRRKFGAMLVDPVRNTVLMDGYNGGPRGAAGQLCGGDTCLRDDQNIVSGTHAEIGCHHAEMNVICNAAAAGIATAGGVMFITGEPCMMCAKLMHHAGVVEVIVIDGGFHGPNGVQYLIDNGIYVKRVNGPKDTRTLQTKDDK